MLTETPAMTDAMKELTERVMESCQECGSFRPLCFCGAPRTQDLREKRLRWAVIEHPASDDINKKIDRMLAEPQSFQSFAKQVERESTALAAEVTRLTKELAAEHERAEVLQSQVDNADVNLEQVKLIQKGIWKSKVESAEARIAELEKQLSTLTGEKPKEPSKV